MAASTSIQTTSQMWPSGSSKLRLYIQPRSCLAKASALPPEAPALSTMPSTSARSSADIAIITSAVSREAIGLGEKWRNLSCVSSMT